MKMIPNLHKYPYMQMAKQFLLVYSKQDTIDTSYTVDTTFALTDVLYNSRVEGKQIEYS